MTCLSSHPPSSKRGMAPSPPHACLASRASCPLGHWAGLASSHTGHRKGWDTRQRVGGGSRRMGQRGEATCPLAAPQPLVPTWQKGWQGQGEACWDHQVSRITLSRVFPSCVFQAYCTAQSPVLTVGYHSVSVSLLTQLTTQAMLASLPTLVLHPLCSPSPAPCTMYILLYTVHALFQYFAITPKPALCDHTCIPFTLC